MATRVEWRRARTRDRVGFPTQNEENPCASHQPYTNWRNYLACGVLAHGFVRVRCVDCGFDRLVAFGCKGRAVCPSCRGRRMADAAAHLVDRVLPRAPYRQWTLSVPWRLRAVPARDRRLLSAALTCFVRAVFRWQRAQARALGIACASPGAVTAIQRFGSVLNLNVHFHTLIPDGVFVPDRARAWCRCRRPPTTTWPRSAPAWRGASCDWSTAAAMTTTTTAPARCSPTRRGHRWARCRSR